MAIHLKVEAKTRCGIVITPSMENEKKITSNIEEVTCKNCQKAMRKTIKQESEEKNASNDTMTNPEDLNKNES